MNRIMNTTHGKKSQIKSPSSEKVMSKSEVRQYLMDMTWMFMSDDSEDNIVYDCRTVGKSVKNAEQKYGRRVISVIDHAWFEMWISMQNVLNDDGSVG